MTDIREDTPEDDSPFRSPQVLETYQEEEVDTVKLLRAVAFYQKFLLISIGLNLFLLIAPIDFARSFFILELGLFVVYLTSILLGVISVFSIVNKLQNFITAFFCTVFVFLPYFNLFILFVVYFRLNGYFQEHGLTTNWLGPDLSTMPKDGEEEIEDN